MASIPRIGYLESFLKYSDEAATVVKYTDEVIDVARHADDLIEGVVKVSDEVIEGTSEGVLRNMMSPDEALRYDNYWDNIGYQKACQARDKLIFITSGAKRKATAIGAHDIVSGNISAAFAREIPTLINKQLRDAAKLIGGVGSKGVNGKNTVGVCAEFQAANKLLNVTGDIQDIRFTEAIRPRNVKIVDTCTNCLEIFNIGR